MLSQPVCDNRIISIIYEEVVFGLIFGNPKVGTPLMLCSQSVAIDLPQKALVWEDESGTVWLAYNDPQYLNQRHGLGDCAAVLEKVSGALGNFAKAATQ